MAGRFKLALESDLIILLRKHARKSFEIDFKSQLNQFLLEKAKLFEEVFQDFSYLQFF